MSTRVGPHRPAPRTSRRLNTYIITFERQYLWRPHPTFPAAHPDGYIRIDAPTEFEARALVITRIGPWWEEIHRVDTATIRRWFPRGELARWQT